MVRLKTARNGTDRLWENGVVGGVTVVVVVTI